MLSPEQEAELKRFTAEKARVRKELRETQRGLDVDINRLNTWLKVINIAIAPLLVAVVGRRHSVAAPAARRTEPGRPRSVDMSRQRFIVAARRRAARRSRGAVPEHAAQSARGTRAASRCCPTLASELNTVTHLSVRKGSADAAVTVHKQGEQWTVAERGDYPADVSKLRKLLLALSDAKIVEEKTSNPANFSSHRGRRSHHSPVRPARELSFVARDGKHAVIVGKSAGEGNFVRRVGENTSYSVEPAISFEAEPRFWIDPQLIDVPAAADIQSIEVKPAAAPRLRGAPRRCRRGHFELDGVPPGRKAVDAACARALAHDVRRPRRRRRRRLRATSISASRRWPP